MIPVSFLVKSMRIEFIGLSNKKEAKTSSKVLFYVVAKRQISNRISGIGKRQTRAIGKDISTKSVNSYERQYLTNDYKWPEGSEEEREAWQTAFNFSSGNAENYAKFLARFP